MLVILMTLKRDSVLHFENIRVNVGVNVFQTLAVVIHRFVSNIWVNEIA